jgi:hypothetical protein
MMLNLPRAILVCAHAFLALMLAYDHVRVDVAYLAKVALLAFRKGRKEIRRVHDQS